LLYGYFINQLGADMKCKNGHSNSVGSEFCGECGVGIKNEKTASSFDLRFIPILLIFLGVIFNFYTTQNEIKEISSVNPIIVNDLIKTEIDKFSNELVYEDASGLPAQQFRMSEWQKELQGLSTTRLLEIRNQMDIQNSFLELYIKNQTYFLMIISGFLALISVLLIKRK
jgi:hypothetical protein